MRDSSIETINKILLLLPYVISRGGAKISEICEDFNLTRDELMYWIEKIVWFCGLPPYGPLELIDYSIDGKTLHFISADYFRKPFKITRNEALVLLIACRALVDSGVIVKTKSLMSALDKIQNTLGENISDEIKDVKTRIEVEMKNFSKKWVKILEKGIAQRRNLMLDYYSYSRDEVSTREVEPISLIWANGNWYLQGFCHLAGDFRFFMLDRILDVKVTRKKCKTEVKGELHIPQTVCEYSPGKGNYTVQLIFSDRMALPFLERLPQAELREEKGGSICAKFHTKDLSWVANSLLKFGERVRIVSPEELRSLVREKAETLVKYYS